MLAPPLAATVSSVMSLGFTARETLPIVFFGFAICSVVITLTGKMGATYHVPYPVVIRSIFGMFGSYPMIILRCQPSHVCGLMLTWLTLHLAFVAAMWTAILCVQAGDFLKNCIEAIWPSFKNFPNHLPESAGITCMGSTLPELRRNANGLQLLAFLPFSSTGLPRQFWRAWESSGCAFSSS